MGIKEDQQLVTNTLERLRGDARREAWVCAAFNLVLGLGWLLGHPNRTDGSGYDAARMALSWQPFYPIRVWGALLIFTALGVVIALMIRSSRTYSLFMGGLTAIWIWWACCFGLAFLLGTNSLIGAVLSVGFMRRHLVLSKVQPWQIKG